MTTDQVQVKPDKEWDGWLVEVNGVVLFSFLLLEDAVAAIKYYAKEERHSEQL